MSSGNKIREKPNPLFEKWIAEWLADATEKNSEVRHGYRRVSKKQRFAQTIFFKIFIAYLLCI